MEITMVDVGSDGGGGGGGSTVVEVNMSACDDEISSFLVEVLTKKPPRMTIFFVYNLYKISLKKSRVNMGKTKLREKVKEHQEKVTYAGYDRQGVADHANNMASKIHGNLTNSLKALNVDILTVTGSIVGENFMALWAVPTMLPEKY